MDCVKRIWYLSPMRAAKVQASLRIRAVSPEPSLLAHTSSESRGTFRQKARSLAPLNGEACAVEICHDGMLEDRNSLVGAHIINWHPFNGPVKFLRIEVSTVYYGHFQIQTLWYEKSNIYFHFLIFTVLNMKHPICEILQSYYCQYNLTVKEFSTDSCFMVCLDVRI